MIQLAACDGNNIAFVDDHVEALSSVRASLEGDGYRVHPFKSIRSVERDTQIHDDAPFWVVDKRFGNAGPGAGLRLFRKLQKKKNRRIVLLTAYAEKDDSVGKVRYDKKLNNLSVVVNKPDSFAIDFKRVGDFLGEIFSAASLPETLLLERFGEGDEYNRYCAMSEDEQDTLLDSVLDRHSALVEKGWEGGAVWVGIFGSQASEVKSVSSTSDIPSDEELDAMCQRLGLPAFVSDKSLAFNSTMCSATAHRGGALVSTYPYLNLDVPGHVNCKMHFDNGCDVTLVSQEFVDSVHDAKKAGRSIKRYIQSKPHTTRSVSFSALLRFRRGAVSAGGVGVDGAQSGASSAKAVDINGLAVKKWSGSDLAVKCSSDCGNSSPDGYCVYRRSGIVGRNFYIDNKINLVLSHLNPEIALLELEGED